MVKTKISAALSQVKGILGQDQDFLKDLVRQVVQDILEAEMESALGAAKGERINSRLGYRSGYYGRTLITRVGKLELRVPQDRQGHFSTQVFERYQRSEKALVSALAEMYVQGVSTRKVKAITEELCGHSFSASAVSSIVKRLDDQLAQFAGRSLEEPYPYLIVDARYEKVRDAGAIRSRAVLIAIGVDWDGRRQILAVELANRESASSWKQFLLSLKQRGLKGVEMVVSDDHAGLKKAIAEVLPEAFWQRCYVHFLRNALDYLPRKGDDDCLRELRWLYERRDLGEARKDLAAWLSRWQDKYPKLCSWVEDNVGETLSFYRLPLGHHKHLKSTNMLERLNEEIRRRTRVVRIFPNEESCLRLIRALAVETHENWIEANRYLDMNQLREHKKHVLMELAA
ncbi:IS256 family transposase [uncultured Desulfosarcina sp.]|uniref:IS256 family transposase n=1 Tax=uncultured Desulfosarcina sp. TaxID=218289 RepID=UPI0029C80554|nr:IS256 family transposase [uncultured Desulfosarcina sp.]